MTGFCQKRTSIASLRFFPYSSRSTPFVSLHSFFFVSLISRPVSVAVAASHPGAARREIVNERRTKPTDGDVRLDQPLNPRRCWRTLSKWTNKWKKKSSRQNATATWRTGLQFRKKFDATRIAKNKKSDRRNVAPRRPVHKLEALNTLPHEARGLVNGGGAGMRWSGWRNKNSSNDYWYVSASALPNGLPASPHHGALFPSSQELSFKLTSIVIASAWTYQGIELRGYLGGYLYWYLAGCLLITKFWILQIFLWGVLKVYN